MAPFMAATLPLHSWRIVSLRRGDNFLRRRLQSIDSDSAGLRTAIKANAAACAAASQIARRMHAVAAQLPRQFQALRGTRFHAQSAAFALFHADGDFSSRLARHASPLCQFTHFLLLQPFSLFAILIKFFAELRMRDFDERLGALTNGFSVQISDSVLGNDVASETTRGDHA